MTGQREQLPHALFVTAKANRCTAGPIRLIVTGWGDYPTLSCVAAVTGEEER